MYKCNRNIQESGRDDPYFMVQLTSDLGQTGKSRFFV